MKLLRRQVAAAAIFVFWMFGAAAGMRADVAVLVGEPYGDMSGMNPAGHAAIYLNHVCAETPLKLRHCGPGELGVVISRYNDVSGYDWVAVPLVGYLYAVDSVDEVPATMDGERERVLRDAYRRKHLELVAPDAEDGSAPRNNWYQLAGAAYDRTIYGFQVKTTVEQDERLIAMMNDRRNVERYNGAFRNCADFARVTINRYYPHAVKRNLIADVGMTTPKQVAHGLTQYGKRHPEAQFTTFVVKQVPGSLERSHGIKGVTECLVTCKRYMMPTALLMPGLAVTELVAYLDKGRFRMPKDAPELRIAAAEPVAVTLSLTMEGEADGSQPTLLRTQEIPVEARPAAVEEDASGGGGGR